MIRIYCAGVLRAECPADLSHAYGARERGTFDNYMRALREQYAAPVFLLFEQGNVIWPLAKG